METVTAKLSFSFLRHSFLKKVLVLLEYVNSGKECDESEES